MGPRDHRSDWEPTGRAGFSRLSARQSELAAAALAAAPVSPAWGMAVPVQRGWSVWHQHDHLELVYHEGTPGLARLADGRAQAYEPGSIVLLPGGLDHDSRTTTDGTHHCLLLADVPAAANVAGYLPPGLADAHAGRLRTLMGALMEMGGEPVGGPLGALALRLELTALLAGLLGDAARPFQAADPAADYVRRARGYLDRHCGEIRHLSSVASAVGISYDHLRRLYREREGETLKAALDRARLARAQQLLATSGLPLKAIADACGYASDRHLCDRFRRATGQTPGDWRAARTRSGS